MVFSEDPTQSFLRASEVSVHAGTSRFPVVGMGASDGGLAALSGVFHHLPKSTGMAYVVVHAEDAERHDRETQILAEAARMPVIEVNARVTPQPDRIYLAPRYAHLCFREGALEPVTRSPGSGRCMPVDAFLSSLAEERGSQAIGAVLSGAGSDGALGIAAIRGSSGFTFAQDDTAQCAAMPRHAICGGFVDYILPPEGIAHELARIGRSGALVTPSSEDDEHLAHLLQLLQSATGIDNGYYRRADLRRYLDRRRFLHRIERLEDYVAYTREHARELVALHHELLFHFARFFRDPVWFDILASTVVRGLVARRPFEPLRIWVPGCSTGEEAYSMAMLALEALGATKASPSRDLKIFGTDLSEVALERARAGQYPEGIALDVTPERLERFFVKEDGGYRIQPFVREVCVFAKHDLTRDPVIREADIISGRHCFPSMSAELFDRVLPILHYGLRHRGILVTGKRDIEGPAAFFQPVDIDPRHKFYVKKVVSTIRPMRRGATSAREPSSERNPRQPDIQSRAAPAISARYTPAGVIINDEGEILHFQGKTSSFLTPSPGAATLNLFSMVREGLLPELRAAIEQVANTDNPVRRDGFLLREGSGSLGVNMEVLPISIGNQRCFTVLFEKTSEQAQRDGTVPVANDPIAGLKEELRLTNEKLSRAREELSTAQDELRTLDEDFRARVRQARVDALRLGEQRLERARQYTESIIATVSTPLVVLDTELRVVFANRAFYDTFRTTPAATEWRGFGELGSREWANPALIQLLDDAVRDSKAFAGFIFEQEFAGIGLRKIRINARRLVRQGQAPRLLLLAMEDVTEHHRLEAQLRQAQKMEAIGHLAAGIAHDFNNLITVINGSASLLLEEDSVDDSAKEVLRDIGGAGERAAVLTRQLLAFSRKQMIAPKRLDVNALVTQTERMLRRLIGEHIRLITAMEPRASHVLADPVVIEQILLNLAINARDAMPDGGDLTIETSNVEVSDAPDAWKPEDMPAGPYVLLVVRDTGCGMSEEAQSRIFDPFYSTKDVGKGSGIGLASVLASIQQSGGFIHVESQLERGSAFSIYLPRLPEGSLSEPPRMEVASVPHGTETILLVEDAVDVRKLTHKMLETAGYDVLDAEHGKSALEIAKEHRGPIHLLVTDVVMPQMGGPELADLLLSLRPELKVLLLSGYAESRVVSRIRAQGATELLQKPYGSKVFLQKVRDVLDTT